MLARWALACWLAGRSHRPHAAVILLGRHLASYALEHGGIVVTETGFILGADPPRVYGPDLAYLRENPGEISRLIV